MKLSIRQGKILSLVEDDGQADVDGLAQLFDVSTQTIRRDLTGLCDLGLTQRTHGGVKRTIKNANAPHSDRIEENKHQKNMIALAAATLVPNNCSIALNIGTTTERVARAIKDHKNLMVLSNNLNIITQFVGSSARELILVGGSVRQSDGAIIGEGAVDFISRYKVDFAIIGASSLDSEGSVLDFDEREVAVARAILKNARTKILVCDSSKFARTAPVRICQVGELDYFVTDCDPPEKFKHAAELAGTKIILAGTI